MWEFSISEIRCCCSSCYYIFVSGPPSRLLGVDRIARGEFKKAKGDNDSVDEVIFSHLLFGAGLSLVWRL